MSADETALTSRTQQVTKISAADHVANRLLLTYASSGIICALMFAISIGLYQSVPENESKLIRQIGSSIFLGASIVFVMATYASYLQVTTVCALKEEEDMTEFQREWGHGAWKLFNVATALLLCGFILDSYERFGDITFFVCCAFGIASLVFWGYVTSCLRTFLSDKQKQF